jgi:hypothetical protein
MDIAKDYAVKVSEIMPPGGTDTSGAWQEGFNCYATEKIGRYVHLGSHFVACR